MNLSPDTFGYSAEPYCFGILPKYELSLFQYLDNKDKFKSYDTILKVGIKLVDIFEDLHKLGRVYNGL